jgi:two-component system, LytTR family, response regulator
MIKAILIDDEKNALEVLEMQLKEYCPEVEVIATASSGQKGIEAIKKYNPDVVFLDIEMPIKNGFDVLKETNQFTYKIVFTTAYDQFAIKAFKYATIDYLLKPIDIVELQEAVKKLSTSSNDDLKAKIEVLFNQLKGNEKYTQKIALPIGEALQFFEPDEILRFESDSNYTHIYLLKGKKITLAKTLKEIEETVNGKPFFRVHQSHLVNMNHIQKLHKGEAAYLTMLDDSVISISRNKKDAFMESFRKL